MYKVIPTPPLTQSYLNRSSKILIGVFTLIAANFTLANSAESDEPSVYAVQRGKPFDITAANRLPADNRLYDWSKAGFRETGVIPDASKRTHRINATTFGLIANDGRDDSAALQAAINSAATLARNYDNLAVIELPSGTINIGKQIDLHVSFVVLKGQTGDPTQINSVTQLVFEPDVNTRYDKVIGDLPDFDGMVHKGSDMDWIWPGRGLLKVQTLDVHGDYNRDYASAPENRKDIFEGSVNFHWKAKIDVLQNGNLVAAAGSTVIPLDSTISTSKMNPLKAGTYVVVKAADTMKMYQEQGVNKDYWADLFMKMQMFKLVSVDATNKTITIDRPLEFDLYANNVSDGSKEIGNATRTSRVVPLTVVEGVGIEDLFITHPISNLSVASAKNNYTNLAPEHALHGIVFKWAVNCWVRGVHTYMTGSHAVVSEEAKNIQIEESVFQGSWNKGAGGNGYFRCSRLWDSLIHNNTIQDLRHLTMQWSSSGNVVIGNHLDCDINFHGGWERFNLIEQNEAHVPSAHGNEPGSHWYPIWWGTGPKAGAWAGATGPRNVLYNNVFSKQMTEGAPFAPYLYGLETNAPHRILQFGWDRETESGSHWLHLQDPNGMLDDWAAHETVDFSTAPYDGVNARLTANSKSIFLKPDNSSYRAWAITHFGRKAVEESATATASNSNPDGDTLSNLAEYAFSGDPESIDGFAIAVNIDNNTVNIDFPYNPYAVDLRYELLSSTNLVDWTTVDPTTYTESIKTENLDGNYLFQVNRISKPMDRELNKVFYKIRVQQTP